MKPVTDPNILSQLNSGKKPVSDPNILAQLEGKKSISPWQKVKDAAVNLGKHAVGMGEGLMNTATNFTTGAAGQAVAGLSGLNTFLGLNPEEPGLDLEAAKKVTEESLSRLQPKTVYQPRSQYGEEHAKIINRPFEEWSQSSHDLGNWVAEKTGSNALGAVAGVGMEVAPIVAPIAGKAIKGVREARATVKAEPKPVTDPALVAKLEEAPVAEAAPKAEPVPETPRPTHENLGQGVTAADSLELQNAAPEVKPVVKGTPQEMLALDNNGALEGKVLHQEGDAVYAIDPTAINPDEAKAAIAQGGDAESAVLGYPKREGLTTEETTDVAVTKQGEVVTDLPQMKAETEAGNVAWAAEGKPEEAIPQAEMVAEGIKAADANQQSGIDLAQRDAATILDQTVPENGPVVGMSTQQAIPIDDSVVGLKSVDPKVEQRMNAAHGLDDGPSVMDRIKARLQQSVKEMQHFPELRKVEDAQTADILRQYESSNNAIKAKVYEYLRGVTAEFGPNKMKVFERKVLLDDLMGEAEKGRELPFGYTPETLAADHATVTDLVSKNPDIAAAIERRQRVQAAVVDEAITEGILPESVKENPHYFRHMVLEYANAKRWAGLSNTEVRAKRRGWQKQRQGSEKDINTNFLEAEYEVMSQTMKEIATAKTLKKVLDTNAVKLKEGEAIPEGYVEWQPEKGNVFYRGQTLPEKMMEQFMEDNPYFNEIVDKFSEVTIKGGKKKAYVIPEGVAKTLDNLRTFKSDPLLGAINRKMIGAWKVWTLLSPRRAIKYNLNNMSGDLDACLAADPMIVKYMGDAYRSGWDRMQGRAMTQMDIDMLDRGVLDSGISINEIPDINTLPGFHKLSPTQRRVKLWQAIKTGNLKALAPPNLIAKYFDKISAITNLREGLLREAAYKRALELLGQGKEITWASDPKELAAIPDIRDKAAKLSRELVGDYGNISVHGEAIRERYLPFWSWMEINTPRYYRIFKNAALEGKAGSTAARMAGVGARKVAGATLGIAEKLVMTQMLFASISAFNHLMFPDEESSMDQKNLHLILGKTSEGKTLSVRFQGAFSDALSWFGLEDYPDVINKMQSGKMDTSDLMRKMALATPNKLANAALPYAKLGAELITKKTWYPDITNPRPIRDRAEHAARFLSLDNEYRAATGKPSKGYGESLKGAVVYESDPGENAYNYIRGLGYEFMEKKGKEIPQGEPTERSNALYYFKQALRYGDKEAAKKYLDKYKELGGKQKGIESSVGKSAPLAMLGKNRKEFEKSLSAEDRQKLLLADRWYKKVYGVK